MPKTSEKLFYKNVTVGLSKTAGKNIKYSGNETILKIGHLAKAIAHAKAMLSLGQKLKIPKTCEKLFYKNITVGLCKNRWKKHQIFGK